MFSKKLEWQIIDLTNRLEQAINERDEKISDLENKIYWLEQHLPNKIIKELDIDGQVESAVEDALRNASLEVIFK